MIVCGTCGKENQDLYKFCLGCGSDLGPTVAPLASSSGSPKRGTAPPVFSDMGPLDGTDPSMTVPTEPTQTKWAAPTAAPASAPAPTNGEPEHPPPPHDEPDASAVAPESCPSCGALVPPNFAFCASCGARVGSQPPGPISASRAVASSSGPASGRMILVRPDGTEGGSHPLVEGENLIGRGAGALFEADGYLSPRHAELVLNAAGLVLRDCGSLNGVFVKLAGEEELYDGDVFRIGQELLRFESLPPPEPLDDGTEILGSPNPGFWGRLAVIVGRDQDGSAFPLFGDAIILGRERGDILFPEDGYVSGAHARVSTRDGHAYLADLNSSNGTFLRIRGDRVVPSGSFILMGQQLFRINYP
ncbi:MAG TPA: FHA domain-containing protein [Polyangia bacterium]|nr:FHA domain-containing protein [Polyangia bacterium]